MIYVTHDQEEALAISDRVALMHSGRIEQIGTPGDIYSKPANLFTATFVGVNNLIEGEHIGGGLFRWGGGTFSIPHMSGLSKGSCILSVRPEKLRIAGRPEPKMNLLSGVCKGRVFLGPLMRLAVESHGETFLVDLLNENLREFPEGSKVDLCFSPEDALLIDR
jgi:ABC-type Fe3+/spermidine/putrescine transport system ATPase subunit